MMPGSHVVRINLSAEQYERLRAHAEADGLTMPLAARRFVLRGLRDGAQGKLPDLDIPPESAAAAAAAAAALIGVLAAFGPTRWTRHGRDRIYLNNLDSVFGDAAWLHGYSRRGCRVSVDVQDRTLRIRLSSLRPDADPPAMHAALTTAVLAADPSIQIAQPEADNVS